MFLRVCVLSSLHEFSQSWAGMLYVDNYIIQYVKFWDSRRATMHRRTRAHVVPEETEGSTRRGGGLVLPAAAASSLLVSGDSEITPETNSGKLYLSEIEEEASSQMISSEVIVPL